MLRKIVYDAYHNNFIDKAKKLEDEYKAREKKSKMSAPNTAFGEDLTVGGQLKSIQEYNEMLDLKREEKVRKAHHVGDFFLHVCRLIFQSLSAGI